MKNRLIPLLFLPLIFSCRKEATSWATSWVVPVLNDSLNLKSLTNDTTLSVNNNFYEVALTRTLARIKPEDYLDIPDTLISKDFTIPISNFSLPPGVSFVSDAADHLFELDDVLLRKARVKSGKVKLTVTNPLNTACVFEIELPETVKNGGSFKQNLTVPAKKTEQIEVDLAGYEMDLRGTSGTAFNALRTRFKVSTDPNGGATVINPTDTTSIDIDLKNLVVDYALGYFGQYKAADTYTIQSDIINEQVSGTIDLPALRLEFLISNGLKAMAQANIMSVSNSNTQTGVTVPLISSELNKPFTIQNATGSWGTLQASQKSLVFDETNSNIEPFIENLGGTFNLAYDVQLNPYGNITSGYDEFFPNSELDLICKLNMPLTIGLYDFQLKDTFDFKFSQDLTQTHAENGMLYLKLENGFPMEGIFDLYFLDDQGQILSSFTQLGPILSSLKGNNNAQGIPTCRSTIEVALTPDLILQLNSAAKIAIKAKFNTPDPATGAGIMVSIPEHAFLWVKAQLALDVQQIIPQ